MLDRLPLPPISPNVARLMRAIANRQGLPLPDVALVAEQSGTVWNDRDVKLFAKLYDGIVTRSQSLEKIFNPGSAWDPAKHPRWPAGQPDGGEFRPGDGATGEDASPIQPVSAVLPPIGKLVLGDPPTIPGNEPATEQAKNVVRKAVAQWLARAVLAGADVVAAEIVLPVQAAVEGAFWLAPYVGAYLDGPKTLEELQTAVNSPRKGTDVHHIVEQTPARNDKFPEAQIEDPSNLARISTLKHWELNRWYERPNEAYGGRTTA
jgi:hypothetical protein